MRLYLSNSIKSLVPFFLAGFLIPLGFAPFHLPGFSILGVGLFFYLLLNSTSKTYQFASGFIFGMGFFGLGVSWIYVSIHVYGHLNPVLASLITLFFICYLSLFTGLISLLFKKLNSRSPFIISCIFFGAVWCIVEFFRSTLFGGFPWLLLGFSQMDTPLKYLLPLVGVYGVSFFVCLSATFFVAAIQKGRQRAYLWALAALFIILGPQVLQSKSYTTLEKNAQPVGIIQANLSMRDKWDESLFWVLLQHYQQKINELIGNNRVIIMPESAFPLPPSYIADFLDALDKRAKEIGSSILIGIPQPANADESQYYNSMITLGAAEGVYLKQHLVPFGEYIPSLLQRISDWLALPSSNMKAGKKNQKLISVNKHPIATLICYELAYPELLRKQLPEAQWIASISDDGWFGHSFAMYQQLQMAQALSLQTGRYQVVANNDGLSSVINEKGKIIASLPAFKAETLKANVIPATGATPWVYYGDTPIIIFFCLILLGAWLPFYRVREVCARVLA